MQSAEAEVLLRIIEYLESKGTHKDHRVQLPEFTELGTR